MISIFSTEKARIVQMSMDSQGSFRIPKTHGEDIDSLYEAMGELRIGASVNVLTRGGARTGPPEPPAKRRKTRKPRQNT